MTITGAAGITGAGGTKMTITGAAGITGAGGTK
jgi:hypothetical protein